MLNYDHPGKGGQMKTWMSQFFQWLQRIATICVLQLFALRSRSSRSVWTTLASEEGEGVISTAIVVMIMAFLAVGLWVAFKLLMSHATGTINQQVSQIGQ
jgi:hypothetical protein